MSISNTAIIIMGASGDLARRKLIPALHILFQQKYIDKSNCIIGTGRKEFTDSTFRERFDVHPEFSQMLCYHQGTSGIREYVNKKKDFSQIIIFMALPPHTYGKAVKELHEEGFGDDCRIIVEKPFGTDYKSAVDLNKGIHEYFKEDQIFRIDHYLAKEAVQNILVFRFANSLFYPVWNSRYVQSIQINAIEDMGVENRAQYFDESGIIRDMVQNHLFQLLALLTMEAPTTLTPEDIQIQKVALLKAMELKAVRKYQYEGYTDETGIPADSTTETFAELEFRIHNFRWTGIPIYIRTGKALHRKGTEIGLRFKPLPKLLYNSTGELNPNKIIFKIQPSAGIIVDLVSKIPGSSFELTDTNMEFCYLNSFNKDIPEAYQKCLLDALKGDKTLFVSSDEVEISWKIIEEALKPVQPEYYKQGHYPATSLHDRWIDFDQYKTMCT